MPRQDLSHQSSGGEHEYTPAQELDDHLNEYMHRDCCTSTCEECAGFRALAHYLVANDCVFRIEQMTMFEGAIFELEDDCAAVRICRADATKNIAGTRKELVFLAHETGHWQSYATGRRHPDLDEATSVRWQRPEMLTTEQKHIVVDEEERAWDEGEKLLRQVVPNLPDAFWALFSTEKTARLTGYRNLPPNTNHHDRV